MTLTAHMLKFQLNLTQESNGYVAKQLGKSETKEIVNHVGLVQY